MVTKPNRPCRRRVKTPTNPYRILCSRCENHWWFWFGLGDITIAYHVSILGLNRPRVAFTNHYHRTEGDGGLGDDLGAGGVVRWLGTMVRVIIA